MTIQTVEQNNIVCDVIKSDEKVFTEAQYALDVLMTAPLHYSLLPITLPKISSDGFS